MPLIKHFIENTQHHSSEPLAILQGDGAYKQKALLSYLETKHIKLQTSAPYSPGQNGKAERVIQTLATRTVALLAATNQPKNNDQEREQ